MNISVTDFHDFQSLALWIDTETSKTKTKPEKQSRKKNAEKKMATYPSSQNSLIAAFLRSGGHKN